MTYWIWLASLLMSIISFLLFVLALYGPKPRSAGDFGAARQEGELEPMAKLVEAVTKLLEGLNKSTPPALAIFASMVFMAISLMAARS